MGFSIIESLVGEVCEGYLVKHVGIHMRYYIGYSDRTLLEEMVPEVP